MLMASSSQFICYKTYMKKRSITISGHQTSITLEDEFWAALKTLAAQRGVSVNRLIAEIDAARGAENLSSALRVYILKSLQDPTQ